MIRKGKIRIIVGIVLIIVSLASILSTEREKFVNLILESYFLFTMIVYYAMGIIGIVLLIFGIVAYTNSKKEEVLLFTQESQNVSTLKYCRECGYKLEPGAESCPFCGRVFGSMIQAKDFDPFNIKEPIQQRKTINKKAIWVFASITAVAVISVTITISVLTATDPAEVYAELSKAMRGEEPYSFEDVEELLEKQKKDYKNTEEIKEEYNNIKEQINIIRSVTYDDEKCELARNAYLWLIEFDNNNEDWDMTQFIKDKIIDQYAYYLISGKMWTMGTYIIDLYFEKGQAMMYTNLPNFSMEDEVYYIYFDQVGSATVLRYENATDTSDTFNAYYLILLEPQNGRLQIQVDCLYDNTTYIME